MPDQWTNDARPQGAPNPDVPGETWDAQAGAWSSTGLTPEPPALSEDEIVEIENLFKGAVERDLQYPLLVIADQSLDLKIVSFAYHQKSRLTMLGMTIRGLMKMRWDARTEDSNCAYDAATRAEFKFNDWVQRAGDIKRLRTRELNRLTYQATQAASEEAATRQRNDSLPRIEEGGQQDLTASQMMEHNAPYLVAIGHILDKRAGRIWYDEFHNKVMTDWNCNAGGEVSSTASLSTQHELNLMRWLMSLDPKLSKMSKITLKHVIAHVAYLTKRHCVREWIESLEPWSEEGEISADVLSYLLPVGFATEQSEYTRRVGMNWLVSMVARVMRPGCKVDTMPVFYGAQGLAKSSAMNILAGQWYGDVTEKADAKDFLMKLQGKWLIEIAEMHSVATSRVEMAHVKAMLTRQEDRFRPPYGDAVQEFPRQMVFGGTTNMDDWHTDITGGRRFNPVCCLGVLNLSWIEANREVLFAQALHLYRGRFEWWKVPEAEHHQALERQSAVGAYDNIVADWLDEWDHDGQVYGGDDPSVQPVVAQLRGETMGERWGNVVTTERVIVQCLGMTISDVARHQIAVGNALRKLGWTRRYTRLGGRLVRHWFKENSGEVTQGNLEV